MVLQEIRCPRCDTSDVKVHTRYRVQGAEQRKVYGCAQCACYFSETFGTALAGLRTPLSRIQQIFDALNDGMGVKEALLLYALCHQFVQQVIEGDELYTKVYQNTPPTESSGWTVVLMDRASRFIWELRCGTRERSLFERSMQTLAQVVAQTDDLTLLTDGERRYGALLFEICRTVLRTGQRGRPRQTLPKGVRVRLKNKGSQAHRRGPKRPKYEAPLAEHPETDAHIAQAEIHANHLEGFNASLRRRVASYRRKSNTYAKKRAVAKSA